jgi:hypothetical protein
MRMHGWWWRGRGTPVAANAAAERRIRLAGLVDVVTRAVALQAAAEDVIAACAAPGDTPAAVARRGGRIAAEYYRLHGWAADLARGGAPDSLPARAVELIHYHATMLDMYLKLAFPRISTPVLEHRRCEFDGFGEPARVLRETRVLLVLWLNEQTEAQDPGGTGR